MKKLFLVGCIFAVGAISANTTTPKNGNDKKEVISKNEDTKTVKTADVADVVCLSVVVTCTSATTCQDWTGEQWMNWAHQIQSNYCMIDSPYEP